VREERNRPEAESGPVGVGLPALTATVPPARAGLHARASEPVSSASAPPA
jgi:hypothetical protein